MKWCIVLFCSVLCFCTPPSPSNSERIGCLTDFTVSAGGWGHRTVWVLEVDNGERFSTDAVGGELSTGRVLYRVRVNDCYWGEGTYWTAAEKCGVTN